MATLSLQPAELNLKLYRGDDVSFTVLLKENGVPTSLPTTGWKAQVRDKDNNLLASFMVDTQNAATGVLVFTLPAASVLALPTKAVWDAQCDTGKIKTWLAGDIVVGEQVTV